MKRRTVVDLARLLLCAAFSLSAFPGSAAPVPTDQVDRFYENWDRALAEHAANPAPRQRKIEQAPAPVPPDEMKVADTGRTPGKGNVVAAGGKRIPAPPKPAPAPEPAVETPAEQAVDAATAEVAASTETVAPVLPTPTPGLVKIKVAKVVGGKIIEVEVLVTPTPGPVGATGTAQADLPQVTGEMAALQQQLKMASAASKKKIKFTRGQLRTLLTEFQAARTNNPNFDKILPRSKALQVQASLQRSSSLAQGGELPPATAKSLLTLLFPAPKPKAPPGAAPAPNEPQGEEVNSEENYYVEEGSDTGQAEIYIDPDTGQEVYWDGSPVYSEDGAQLPPPEGYYEEPYYEEALPEGEEYYYEEGSEEGEVYYEEENGEVYYEEEPSSEEEGSY